MQVNGGHNRQPRRWFAQAGLSLVEILIVLAITAMALGGVSIGLGALTKANTRGAASRLAAGIRYVYDRAVTSGAYYRIVFDLKEQRYWVEKSDERYFLTTQRDRSPRGRDVEDEEAAREKEREEKEKSQPQYVDGTSGNGVPLLPPPAPKRARFEAFKDSNLPQVELKGVRIRDIYTPRLGEPKSEGKAYLYFFPDGHTERALIHISDADETDSNVYTLRVYTLTGKVELEKGDSTHGRELELDYEGRSEAPR